MTWVKIDDGFPEHPKILGLSDSAFRLHLHALCYAARNLTDGALPKVWLTGGRGRAVPKAVTQLVDAGLWDVTEAGWQIHDYLKYQPSRAHVEAQRQQTADRVKRFRNAPVTQDVTPLHARIGNAVVTMPPSRPVPSPTHPQETAAEPRRFDRAHADHVNGFCEFKCLSDAKVTEFARDLPHGLDDPGNYGRVIRWAEHIRDTWGDKPKVEFKWWEFWQARWQERSGASSAKTSKTKAALQRFVERHS